MTSGGDDVRGLVSSTELVARVAVVAIAETEGSSKVTHWEKDLYSGGIEDSSTPQSCSSTGTSHSSSTNYENEKQQSNQFSKGTIRYQE